MSKTSQSNSHSILVPVEIGPITQQILTSINKSDEIASLWQVTNVVAQERLNMTDHGLKHFQIVAHNALLMLQLLHQRKITSHIEKNYHLSYDHAQSIVLLASLLHDIGMSIHREGHEMFSVIIASDLLKELLDFIPLKTRIILKSEILHAIISHRKEGKPLTLEAGIVRVADALDLTRSRINQNLTSPLDIHSVSAAAIDEVEILSGHTIPIKVNIVMNHTAGLFHVDELLKRELIGSGIEEHIQVNVFIEKSDKRQLFKQYLRHS